MSPALELPSREGSSQAEPPRQNRGFWMAGLKLFGASEL